MTRSGVFLIGAVTACFAAPASAQPEVDIYVGQLALGPASAEITGLYNATDRPGYDNQPWFSADGASILYARRDDGDPDIYRFSLADRTSTRLTRTPRGDLSPSTVDGSGEFLALSRGGVEDGLWGVWRFAASGDPIEPFSDPLFTASYYGVANDDIILGWRGGDGTGTLVRGSRVDGTVEAIRDRVAPSPPQRIPGESGMSIVEPDFLGQMWITRVDVDSGAVTPIVPAVGDGWHYAWTPDGRLLMADGDAIHIRDPNVDDEWRMVARFPELTGISRIVVSPDGSRIALVAEPR